MWTFQLRYVRCGKAGCRCSYGAQHGPYWYGYEHRGNRVYTRYFGKRPTSSFKYAPPASSPSEPPARFVFHGRMDSRTALRIFGLEHRPNSATLKSRYRLLAYEHHPDRGGDTQVMAAINRAYAYFR
jgi:DnaJ-domain-containing protein 1